MIEDAPYTAEELRNIKDAERKRGLRRQIARAGFTTNKGHGLSHKKRKIVKESKRINRGKR